MSEVHHETVAGFIGTEYPAFIVQHWPACTPAGHIVYLPPFGEEMNRCRAIVGEQARWFAGRGFTCSILDFYGTGDSPGGLPDASLGKWKANIDELIDSLLKRTKAGVMLWGCRLGGLIALDYMNGRPDTVDQLLLWQPVTSGRAYMTQTLRQRSAGLIHRKAEMETTDEMRKRLAAGEKLEVAGYTLGGDLVEAIDVIDVESLRNLEAERVFWLEHGGNGENTLSERSRRSVDALRERGSNVDVHHFSGPPLWQLHKRDRCEGVLLTTRELKI